MTEPRGVEILDAVTAKALDDPRYKDDLVKHPVDVLRKAGLTIDDGVDVVIHENTADTIHLVLPERILKTIDFGEVNIVMIACRTGGL
jgi:hypothetical protein